MYSPILLEQYKIFFLVFFIIASYIVYNRESKGKPQGKPKSTPTVIVIIGHSTYFSTRPKTASRRWWNGAWRAKGSSSVVHVRCTPPHQQSTSAKRLWSLKKRRHTTQVPLKGSKQKGSSTLYLSLLLVRFFPWIKGLFWCKIIEHYPRREAANIASWQVLRPWNISFI